MKINGVIAAAIFGLIFPFSTGVVLLISWQSDYGDIQRYARGEKIHMDEVALIKLVRHYQPGYRGGFHYLLGTIKETKNVILFADSQLLKSGLELKGQSFSFSYAQPHSRRYVRVGDRNHRLHQVLKIDVDGVTVADARDPGYLARMERSQSDTQRIFVYLFVGSLILYIFFLFVGGRLMDRIVLKNNREKDEVGT